VAQVFNPAQRDKLHSDNRKKSLPAKKILTACGLGEDKVFLDVGCGNGYFSLPAAEIVGSEGEVHAFDISSQMLEDLQERAEAKKIGNLKLYQVNESGVCEDNVQGELAGSGDMVLMANLLHEVSGRREFIQYYLEFLKDQGRLIVIDWRKKEMETGPDYEHRLAVDTVQNLLSEADLELEYSRILNDKYYLIVADKKSRD